MKAESTGGNYTVGTPVGKTRLLGVSLSRLALVAALAICSVAIDVIVGHVTGFVLAVGLLALGTFLNMGRICGDPVWAMVVVWLRKKGEHRGPYGVQELDHVLASRRGGAIAISRKVSGFGPASLTCTGATGAAQEWTGFLNRILGVLETRMTLTVRVSVLPLSLRLGVPQDPVRRYLQERAYEREAVVSVMSPRGPSFPLTGGSGRKSRAVLARVGRAMDGAAYSLPTLLSEQIQPAQKAVTEALGTLSGRFAVDNAHLVEHATYVQGHDFVARALVATRWPGQFSDPRALQSLILPRAPTRVVGLMIQPVAPKVAVRRMRAERSELIAESMLRAHHGFVDHRSDEHSQTARLSLEDEVEHGYRLCRYQIAVVVFAPDSRRLLRAVQDTVRLCEESQWEMRAADAAHREIFEAVVGGGLRGWS